MEGILLLQILLAQDSTIRVDTADEILKDKFFQHENPLCTRKDLQDSMPSLFS